MNVADPLHLVGSTLGHKYVIDSLVRVESLAVVYRATQRIVNRAVAVRVFTSLAPVPAQRRRALYHDLVQDEQKLAELAPLVPAVYPARDVGTLTLATGDLAGEWIPYVVLDWPRGVTLRQLMVDAAHAGQAPRTMHEIVSLLEPVAIALAIAHEHGVVHAGVTPDHVLFTEDTVTGARRAMLLDFGVAKLLRARASEVEVDARTDVAAFAHLLLDLFAASNGAASRGATPRARGLAVSDDVDAVFARALAQKADDRFATVGDLWSALRGALRLPMLRSLTATIPPEDGASSSRSLRPMANSFAPPPLSGIGARASRFLVAAASFAAVCALAGVTYFRTDANDSRASAPLPKAIPQTLAPAPPVAACPAGMIEIPASAYLMGSDDDLDLEKPAHRVSITRFCIDKLEVTTADYEACSARSDCQEPSTTNEWDDIASRDHAIFDPLCNARDPEGKATHPINCVTWEQASTYCDANDKRLPTEAEWELAARGTDGRKYPWGDAPPSPELLNACGKECRAWEKKSRIDEESMYEGDDGWVHTAPVGSFPKGASSFGVEDVVGNVWEWVADWHAPYAAGDAVDPQGPASGEKRVMRGGAWNGAYDSWVRPTFRFAAQPTLRSHGVGFRCAKSI